MSELEELQYSENDPDYIFKIVIIGDSAVGKSNILSRYTKDYFDLDSKSTVGVELSTKLYKKKDTIISVNLWDTAGQERFASITSAYYKGANGALIVYDITRRYTFESVDKWYREMTGICGKNLVIFLVGNKCDLTEKRQISIEEGKEKASMLGINFIETSALSSIGVNEVFRKSVLEMFLNEIKERAEGADNENDNSKRKNGININPNEFSKKKEEGCCN